MRYLCYMNYKLFQLNITRKHDYSTRFGLRTLMRRASYVHIYIYKDHELFTY